MSVGGFAGIGIYGIVLAVVTLVALFTKGWTKGVIIGLVVAYIPFVVFGVLTILTLGSLQAEGNILGMLVGWLILASPILAMIGLFFLVMKLLSRWRD